MNHRRRAFASSVTVSTVLAIAVACGNEINLDVPPGESDANDAGYRTDLGPFPPAPDVEGPDGGAAFLFAGLQPNVNAIAVDSDNVYWATDTPDGGIFTCPKTGCLDQRMLVGQRVEPASIATFEKRVYWTEADSGDIHWCNSTACSDAEPLMHANRSKGGPITLDDAGVYMLDGDDAGLGIAKCRYSDFGCSSTNSNGAPPTALGAGGGFVYFASFGKGELRRLHPSGLAIDDLTSEHIAGVTRVAVTPNGEWIYFVNESLSSIRRANRDRPVNQTTERVFQGNQPRLIAVDDTKVYWTSSVDLELRSCTGGIDCEPQTVVEGYRIGALAVDSSGIWFSSLDDGTIRHIP